LIPSALTKLSVPDVAVSWLPWRLGYTEFATHRQTHDADGILQILTKPSTDGEEAYDLRTRNCPGVRLGQVTIFSPGTEISESASAPCTEMVSPAWLK